MFVQPALAEFGQQPTLAQAVKSIEEQVQIRAYTQKKKMQKEHPFYNLPRSGETGTRCVCEVGLKILKDGL